MENLTDGYYSLGADVNTVKTPEQLSGSDEQVDELSLDTPDEELLKLEKEYVEKWNKVLPEITRKQQENEKYYLGRFTKERDPDTRGYDRRPVSDNQIFTALETFLPMATRANPEAVVSADGSPEGMTFAKNVQRYLMFQADRLTMKLQIMKAARFWSLYLLGVAKLGWSRKQNDVALAMIRPQKLIFDPDATIEYSVYTGSYIGEECTDTAANLKKRFPKKKTEIDAASGNKDGTKLKYREWWTQEGVFWTMKDTVLDKRKNPHWNYAEKQKSVDAFGKETEVEVPGKNHFREPQMPYVFLSVFNLGKGVYDQTSLITQVVGLQDLVDKRLKQIDTNADGTNGGAVVSGSVFTKEQAAQVSEALRRGGTVVVPGPIEGAYKRDMGQPLPNFVYQTLLDYRNEIRNIYGVSGSTPQGTRQEQTVRGKIIARSQDTDRIGGGFTQHLEQFSDQIFNWLVQLFYVYYDEAHTAPVLGPGRTMEVVSIKSSDFNQRLTVSVKENSMIPKDPLTQRNEAMEMFQSGAIDPITFFERMDDPNPVQSAERLFMWKSNPGSLFPNIAPPQAPGTPMQPAPGGPPPAPPPGAMNAQMQALLGSRMRLPR